jgi:hypothetical protein
MEENKKQYLLLMSEIIAKQAIILGPNMAILKARGVEGLVVDNKGNASDIKGDAGLTLQKLVEGYVELSGTAAKTAIDPIFTKYPQIKKID